MPALDWGKLLIAENFGHDFVESLSRADDSDKITLFENFVPNPGGQSHLFETFPLNSKNPVPAYRWGVALGGIGSGKSFCGANWSISRALLFPKARGLITANSYGQLAQATLTTLVEACRTYNVPLEPYRDKIEDNALAIANCQRCYIGPKKAFVYVLSMASFEGKKQTARGMQVRWAWLDEAAYASEQSFTTLDGRLGRGPGKPLQGQGMITTSPNGFNWLYDRAGDPTRGEAREKVYYLVSIPTRENVEYLGQDYIDSLQSNYTAELSQQELDGLFVNTTAGRAYKYFVRAIHALEGSDAELLAYDPTLPLEICLDFNRDPACSVLAQRRRNELHCFKEFYLVASDTIEMGETLARWITAAGYSKVNLYGDATGSSHTANSKYSNWEIIENCLRTAGIRFNNCVDTYNPPVEYRVNSFNILLKNNLFYLDRANCPELTKDLENIVWKGAAIDKSDPARTHLSDAVGYLIYKLFPYRPQNFRTKQPAKPVGIAA